MLQVPHGNSIPLVLQVPAQVRYLHYFSDPGVCFRCTHAKHPHAHAKDLVGRYNCGNSPCAVELPIAWFLSRSKLSLMIAGDDPSSSRFYDALTLGAPNVVISEGWYDQSAPFRCRVPYDEISYFLNEADFQAATYSATTKAMKQLYDNNAELLRRIWEAQRKYAKDLVWHVPGSRVAGNVLEQAFRSCLTEYRGNNDAT
mmetsp:Transcript_33957/g.96226  ORF Transcript_33957/g.96226 Transcript_33957/m.96226 type:complete len:200 (-) Transcript_33957:322-921(-)